MMRRISIRNNGNVICFDNRTSTFCSRISLRINHRHHHYHHNYHHHQQLQKNSNRLFSQNTKTPSNSQSKNPLRIPNKIISKDERVALRKARKERGLINLQQVQQQAEQKSAQVSSSSSTNVNSTISSSSSTAAATSSSTTTAMKSATSATLTNAKMKSSPYIWYLGLGIPTVMLVWGLNDTNSPPAKFSELIGLTGLIENLTDDVMKPSHEKLLPDWSQLPNVPHDIPVPHTLVLDLENTLVSSTWDRQYGWRHAKRPGVDKFLHDMAQYYEIVLFTPSIDGIAEPVINKLDPTGCIMHRLYRDATHYYNGIHVKDISKLNRPLNRIVVLDDDPNEVMFHKDTNLIRVKPYEDPKDRTDDTLKRITPLLIEIARENYSDIPALLRQYQGMDADEIADEQERRINSIKETNVKRSQRGLRGALMLGGGRGNNLPEPELKPTVDDGKYTPQQPGQQQQLTSKDLVGSAPPPLPEKEGGENAIINWLNQHQKEKSEQQMRKMEKWNEIMMKKQKEKQEKQTQQQQQAA